MFLELSVPHWERGEVNWFIPFLRAIHTGYCVEHGTVRQHTGLGIDCTHGMVTFGLSRYVPFSCDGRHIVAKV